MMTAENRRRVFSLPGMAQGLMCLKCGKPLGHVYRVKKTDAFRIREFICPHCNELNTSTERVISSRSRE